MSGSIVVTCVTLVSLSSLAAAAKDPFPVGAVWEGTRTIQKPETKTQEWSLKITERNHTDFKGEITLSGPNGTMTCPVRGSAPTSSGGGDSVNFLADNKGKFRQFFDGPILGDEVSLRFKGSGFNGKEVSGTATLFSPEQVRRTRAAKARMKEAKEEAARQKALLDESLKLSQAELQRRIRSNPGRTPEDRERYAADITAYNWLKQQEKEKNKTPEQRERDRVIALLIMTALSQGGSGPSGDPAGDEERQRKKYMELEEKYRREAEYERERQRRERDR